MAIARLMHIGVREAERIELRPGLAAFIGGASVEVLVHRSVFHGILLQEIDTGELFYAEPGAVITVTRGYTEYCHWHNGPLDKPDNPLRREYCLSTAFTRHGYCRVHADTLRAMYTRCLGSSRLEEIGSCRRVDEKLRGVSYSVYLLSYRHGLKVGVTRTWRLLQRLAEQPHVVATELLRTRSIVEAREKEIVFGRMQGLTERPHKRSIKDVLTADAAAEASRVRRTAEAISERYGFDWGGGLVRVLPPEDYVASYSRAAEASLDDVMGRRLELIDYWGGSLLLYTGSSYILLPAKELMHRDSVGVRR